MQEETDKCTTRAAGAGVRARRERFAEITSGRPEPQGVRQPAKTFVSSGSTERKRRQVRRMSWYERRWRGNSGLSCGKRNSRKGNALKGRRGSRQAAGTQRKHVPDMKDWIIRANLTGKFIEPTVKPWNRGVYAGKRLNLRYYREGPWGKAAAANRTREIRPSGMRGGLRKREAWY